MILVTGATGALRGVERLFLFPRPETVEQVLALARRLGVRRVEDAVTASGLAATFVRPGGFAANALGWAPSIRAEGVVRAPYPELASAPSTSGTSRRWPPPRCSRTATRMPRTS